MKNTREVKLAESGILFFGLILVLINTLFWPLDDRFSLIFLGITLVFFGLPHGSLDHLVAQKTDQQFNFIRFILLYLLQIAVVAICWIFFPLSSLSFFLVISAWHFAETDQIPSISTDKIYAVFITIIYGFGILGWILLSHSNQTLTYLASLSASFANGSGLFLWLIKWQLAIVFCCGFLVLIIAALLSYKNHDFTLVKTVLLLLITFHLPLLTAFAFYFGLWHALHALLDIKSHLSISWKELFIKALPLSAISVAGLILFLIFIGRFHFNLVLLTFIFISALTLPHARVMDGMYQAKKHV